MAIAVCHFNPFSIYFQVLTTYFSLLRQQTQCQNIKEDSELDFIHTLFKKMSHPEFNKYQQLLYDTLLYHTLTIYIQRESNRCFLCSVIFLHSISRVTICKLKSHQILHEKNGLCFQWTHMAQWYFNSFYDTALILTFADSVLPLHVCSSTWCRCAWGMHQLPQKIVVLCSYKKIVWVTILNLTYPDRTETQVRTIFLQLENIHMIITRISFLTWFRMPNTWASRTMGMGASEHDQWRASQSAAPGPIAWLYSLKDFHASVVQTSSVFIHLFCKRWPWSAHMTLKCPWTS